MTTTNVYPYLLTMLLEESKKLLLIDIRSTQEYDAGHIKNACNVSVCKKTDVMKLEKYIANNQDSIIYCNPGQYRDWETDRKSTRLNSSHSGESRMPSSA